LAEAANGLIAKDPNSLHRTPLGEVTQAKARRPTTLGSVLEFAQPGLNPALAMRLDRWSRQAVVAQPQQGSFTVRLKQELHRRFPRVHPFNAAPGENITFRTGTTS